MGVDLNHITSELHDCYFTKKNAERDLSKIRQGFFEAIDQTISEAQSLRQQTFVIEGSKTPEEYVTKWFPGWRLLPNQPGPSYIIEEDPAYTKYSYVSESLGMVFTRGISQATPQLDDDELRESDPELWKSVTYSPVEEVLQDLIDWADGDVVPGIVMRYIDEFGDTFERELKDLHHLPEEDLVRLADYLVPGRIIVKLEPPRKLTPEEIDQ